MLNRVRRRKWPLLVLLAAGGLGAGVAAYATGSEGSGGPPPRASIENWRWAPRAELPAPPKKPEPVKPAARTPIPEPPPAPSPPAASRIQI